MYKKVQFLILLFWCSQYTYGADSQSLIGDYSAHIQAGYSIWFELRKENVASFNFWTSGDDGGQSQEHEEIGVWVLRDGILRIETKKSKYFVFGVKVGKVLRGGQGYILDIQESSLPPDDLVMFHRYYYGRPFGNAIK